MVASVPIAAVDVKRFAGNLLESACDCLVILVGNDGLRSTAAAQIDQALGPWIRTAIESSSIKTGHGDVTIMPAPMIGSARPGAKQWMIIGTGEAAKLTRGKAFELGAIVTRHLIDAKRDRIVISNGDLVSEDAIDSFIAGLCVGSDGQAILMSKPKIYAPSLIEIENASDQALHLGKVTGDSMNVTRRLVNEPPNRIYPESFADAATAIAGEVGLGIEVWDEKRLLAERCRAMLAVGQASERPPRLVILRHFGTDRDVAPIAIVGKGVTFDSGGLSIKPSEGMADMKCDMAGAATVVGVMRAVALLKLPINVIGLCGLAENMIAGDAYRLGDVIETRKGVMIEILNTDAEGRVVLADTLDVAVENGPSQIVDLATLTGACMVALGRDVAGLMSNDDSLCREIADQATHQGEYAWQLPMFEMYNEHISSKVADIKNIGDGRWGGAITAAKFLERFVGDVPWVHIDIAGPAFAESPKPHRDAGATGAMLRTLLGWLQSRAAG